MPHVLLAYTGSNPGAANNVDLTALTDPDFSIRNGHYIFTESYKVAYLFAQSTGMTDARLLTPTYAALNSDGFRIAGFQQSAGVGGVPTLADRLIMQPLMIPQMEEFQFQGSKATATAAQQYGLMSLITDNWNANLEAGPQIMMEATTASFTPAANVWSGPQALVMNANPRGGVYQVIGASVQQTADTLAFRLIFPRSPYYHGRKLRPGWVAQNAIGSFEDVITQVNRFHLGSWGYFHTFELPMVEVLATTSAAMQPVIRLWTVYLGGDLNLLNQKIQAATVA
jgi:hypothetical protein